MRGEVSINKVRTGADQFAEIGSALLRGKRFGLLTNPTGIDAKYRSTIDICAAISEGKLTAFFACEHGLRSEKQAGVQFEDELDPVYGIPVYSLYGSNRKPTAQMMADLDVVIVDIQDLGVRFYTYVTTLIHIIESCAEHGVSLIVLDRPNPLGGNKAEGGLLNEQYQSMVGAWRMPMLTGMTIGEFAQLVNGQRAIPCDLQVIPLIGWSREMEYPDTGLPWLMPSPNMPTIDTVRVYGGHCLFEGTNLSEGRGTTKPFELIGAPWLKSEKLCKVMNELQLPGVHFHPYTFTPMFSKHQGERCHGIFTYVIDRKTYHSVETGLHLLHHVMALHEQQFEWLGKESGYPFIDLLTGDNRVRLQLHETDGLINIVEAWRQESEQWRMIRKPFLLYEEYGE
ncbi:DUF1343 domain-containing protein [Paenibacillus agilis]|uniref:DUF1343 domain-containing protein n=2 Tax=Paenibacillus agilis TaxID=3020863 RepID=A0A559J405_9BACL|nr:DUF1343 domain-containing protein [Paenibacillus agilis]TVX94592.1 DUF1343 domain-containing protein [Paenibacillus agilis]